MVPYIKKKKDFGKVIEQAVKTLDTENIMKNGFKVCGLHPFDPENVNYDLLQFREGSQESETASDTANDNIEQAKLLFENNLDQNLLNDFKLSKSQDEWAGSLENKGLFFFGGRSLRV